MSEFTFPRPHELIASDKYWEGPIIGPGTIFSPEHGVTSLDLLRSFIGDIRGASENTYKAKEISALVLATQHGGSFRKIPEGEPIPIPDPESKKVIKIVEDERHLSSVLSPNNTVEKGVSVINARIDASQDPISEFDELAKQMLKPGFIYDGDAATVFLPSGSCTHRRVSRALRYLRPSEDGTYFVRLDSLHLDSPKVGKFGQSADRWPVLNVGTIFSRFGDPDWLQRVVRAEVLEPRINVTWPKRRGNNSSLKNRGTFLPRAAVRT